MDNTQQIEQVEVSMEKAKEMIADGDAFQRLRDNKDFVRILEKGYFETESKRLTLLLSDPNMQDAENQKMIHDGLIGVGQLFQYFRTTQGLAQQAKNSLVADQETHAELLEEGLE